MAPGPALGPGDPRHAYLTQARYAHRLPTPAYRAWLSAHLEDRQALVTQRVVAEDRGESLEGRTHLDALLISPNSGLALHFESKVLSDVDAN